MSADRKHELRAARSRRDRLLRIARDHAMWPRDIGDPSDPDRQDAVCLCGLEVLDTMWLDDVVLTDVKRFALVHDTYLIAYPPGWTEMSTGGVQLVSSHTDRTLVEPDDLEWLLAQPDLADEFRRAAAVHLQK